MTADELLREAVETLGAAGVANARQEADWLLADALGVAAASLFPHGDRGVSAPQARRLRRALERRSGGEPLQYILGTTEFYGLELLVGPGVLIPRPETERLVDFAAERAPASGAVCDLCTGAGAVALALATQAPAGVHIVGVDVSASALDYARRNQARLGLGAVRFLQSDLFAELAPEQRFGLITANPPYVSPDAYARLPVDVRDHEPREALLAGEGGLAMIRRVARESVPHLTPGGWLLCEISSEQGEPARQFFEKCGYRNVRIRQDYARRDRVVEGQAG